MPNINLSGANARLSYALNGTHVANLRCKQLTVTYGVSGSDTKAKRYRAFYPRQRVQGTFGLTFDFIHWKEFNQTMDWLQGYIEAVLDQNQMPSYMQVRLDARNFVRLGYPTTGISRGDHKASMVFSPTVNFVSVADPRDVRSGIKSLNAAASRTQIQGVGVETNWFYPNSKLNSPGALSSYLYNQKQVSAAAQAAAIQDAINPTNRGETRAE